jgi:calcineurin-like phosphoesterase
MGHHLNGRVTAVVGTHQHIPTADACILSDGTAYQTDAGMCGDYDSVIGMDKQPILDRFKGNEPKNRFTPALGEATICGVIVESYSDSYRAKSIIPIKVGGVLGQ